MRGFVLRAVLLGTVLAGVVAPAAAAEQYEFVASDGTSCVLTLTHATPQDPGGTYTVSWRTGVRCNREMGSILVSSSLTAPPDRWWYTDWPYAWCVNGRLPCYPNAEQYVQGSAPGVEADVFTQSGYTEINLLSSTAVWVLTPVRHGGVDRPLDCAPGQRIVRCRVLESFKPE